MIADPIRHLLQEHKEIMSQAVELREAVEKLAARGEESLPETLSIFTMFGQMMSTKLDLHRRKEDDIFFPALEAILGTEGTPMYVMREEHKDIHARGVLLRDTLHELNEVQHPAIEAGGAKLRTLAAEGGSAEALRVTGEEILRLLDLHFSKEEQILFPMALDVLDDQAFEKIGVQFEQLIADWEGSAEDT